MRTVAFLSFLLFIATTSAAAREQRLPSDVNSTPVNISKTTSNCALAADCLANLEEIYRKKFESDVAEGNTLFHPKNSYDKKFAEFGSFIMRFDAAAYKTWRYPPEAANKGMSGITPVRITFNRKGQIVNVQVLESSGSIILDNEVIRALKEVGQVQGFPSSYSKAEFHLIIFFEYFSGLCKHASR